MPDLTYRAALVLGKAFFRLRGVRIDIANPERIPPTGGAVLAINHISYLDFAFASLPAHGAHRRFTRFMAKESIFRNRYAGPFMRFMRHIPVDREAGAQSFREAVKYLKAGELVGVFPEATMSRSFDIKAMKSGTVRMALAADVPIVPMVVFGAHRMFGYGVKDFSRGHAVFLAVGEPYRVERGVDVDQATDELRGKLRSLLDETVARYPVPETGTRLWWLPARLGGAAPEQLD